MESNDKTVIFQSFISKAKKKIEEKKKFKTEKLYVEDADVTLSIRAITDQEFIDINDFSDNSLLNDKYMIYMSCKELQEAAEEMVKNGELKKHYEIVDMFQPADRRDIAHRILELSGIYADSSVKVISEIEEVKNF